MKRMLLSAVFAGLILSGCSYYSCPTYADAPDTVTEEFESKTILAKP